MKHQVNNRTLDSSKRAKMLSEESDRVAKLFQANNFYNKNQINIQKLKNRIQDAKRKLLTDKTSSIKEDFLNNTLDEGSSHYEIINPRKLKNNSRMTQHYDHRHKRKINRFPTDLSEYQVPHKNAESRSRINFGDTPTCKDSRSVYSVSLQPKKVILTNRQQVDEFELKINILWELYELLISIMRQADSNRRINQILIQKYIKQVTSEKYEFFNNFSQFLPQSRMLRTLRLSRVLQNLSIFQTCLNAVERKGKTSSSQIINFLGYSSSSIVFMLKLIFISHQTALTLSQNTLKILNSINQFQQQSYKTQLRNQKQIIRRMQHNNQIISMLKVRCGKKHGKHCQQFMSQILKSVQYNSNTVFSQIGNNIFQFLSFYLHYEGIAWKLELVSIPPTPYLKLKYSKTIVIQPWGVLVYRKNQKLVVRAHTNKFLQQISNIGFNIIFWTELMPKDADILTNLLLVKDNIYWLYRYHCLMRNYAGQFITNKNKTIQYEHSRKYSRLKTCSSKDSLASKVKYVKDLSKIGCILQNTLIIDYDEYNIVEEQRKLFIMATWKGEKKDTKLIELLNILINIYKASKNNSIPIIKQLDNYKPSIQNLKTKSKNFNHRQRYSLPKSSLH